MADIERKKDLTWQQKLDEGIALNTQDEIKADADYNYRQRLEDEARRKEFEERKRGRQLPRPNVAGENTEQSNEKGKK